LRVLEFRGYGACHRNQACHLANDFEGQLRVAKERIANFPGELILYSQQAMALAALGRLDEVDRVIDSCLTIPVRPGSGTPVSVMEDAAYELRAHGHPEKALAVGERVISWMRSRPPEELKRWRFQLGQAYYLTEHWQEAGQIFKELAGESPQNIDFQGYLGTYSSVILPQSGLREFFMAIQGYLGGLAVRLGNRAEAERIADSLGLLDRRYRFGQHTYCRARIASLLGEKEKAVALLREAFAQGYRFTITVHRDPDFEPLRDYPPYQELLRPKG
jgi:tetratricopeptide (TPR) repeat protein